MMICRRCGMESSNERVCDWCKKPMLPPGGSISAKAKEELVKEKDSPPAPPSEAAPTIRAEETKEEAEVRRPESKPPPPPATDIPGLTALGSHLTEEDTTPQAAVLSTTEQTTNDEILVPLGAHNATGEEGTSTQIYIGDDEEVVRPIERPNKDGSYWVTDATGRRKRVFDNTPAVPDKTRMLRAVLAGTAVAMLGGIITFLIKKEVPDVVLVLRVGDAAACNTFAHALKYGLFTGLLWGGIMGLVLTNFRWGAPMGAVMGAILGWASTSMAQVTCMPFPLIFGVLAGILAGHFSTKGMKRIVSV